MGLDLLIAIRDQYSTNDSAKVTILSTELDTFSLKEAARTKLVKNYSLVNETETKEAIWATLSDGRTHLLDDAQTKSSEALSSSQLKHASEVNFATLMSFDNENEVSECENSALHDSSVDSVCSASQELEGQKFLSHTRWGCK